MPDAGRSKSSMSPSTPKTTLDKTTLDAWSRLEVASYYSSLAYLTPCERLLFDAYLRQGMTILDLGVGGGRTTPHLSSIAGRYVGADFSAEMIAACQKKFAHLEFRTLDAADLSVFADATFDAVVLAFNTIDNLAPDESRHRAWHEIHRVLKPQGTLIFSSHNMTAILVRPSWNPLRLARLANQWVGGSVLYRPLLWSLTAARVSLAVLQALAKSMARIVRRVSTSAFWRGEGYRFDPAHGGIRVHLATPEKTLEELDGFDFRPLRVLGDDYPRASHRYVTDWYYYVLTRL